MAIRLVVMDLDGTLLNSDKLISPHTQAVLEQARAQGCLTTIATGRMHGSAAYFARESGMNAPVISCNGGHVQGIEAATPLFERHLAPPVVRRLLELARRRGWYLNCYIGDTVYVMEYIEDYFYAYRTTKGLKIEAVGDHYADYTENVIQCVIRDLDGDVQSKTAVIEQMFPGGIQAQQNTGTSSDLTPPGVNKAVGVEALLHALHIAPSELMVCGDGDNDLAMLDYARRHGGVAVVPANGLPAARALATYHAPSNDEDGIARAIEELVLRH